MVKTKCILTSTIGQQAAHTTDQLSFPSCSTTATYTKKSISQQKVLENMLKRKLTKTIGEYAEKKINKNYWRICWKEN